MQNTIKIRANLKEGQCEVKMLIKHPMETGRRKDKLTGMLIPEHFIQTLTCEHNGKVVLSSNLGKGVAQNPYLAFWLLDGRIGDTIKVTWIDNLGNSDSRKTKIG